MSCGVWGLDKDFDGPSATIISGSPVAGSFAGDAAKLHEGILEEIQRVWHEEYEEYVDAKEA